MFHITFVILVKLVLDHNQGTGIQDSELIRLYGEGGVKQLNKVYRQEADQGDSGFARVDIRCRK